MHFMAMENLPGLVINSELNDSAFTAGQGDAAFLNKYVTGKIKVCG